MRGIVLVCAMVCAFGTAHAERLRKGSETRDVPDESVEFALKDGWQRIPTVYMRTPEGSVTEVYEDVAEYEERRGYWRMTESEVSAYRVQRAEQRGEEIRREQDDKNRPVWIVATIMGGLLLGMLMLRVARWHLKR